MDKCDDYYTFTKSLETKEIEYICKIIIKIMITYFVGKYCNVQEKHMIIIKFNY